MHAFEYARRQGYEMIRTFNRPVHSPLIALNEKLGFRPRFSYVTLEKCLREVAKVDSRVYEGYVGRYQDTEQRPELILLSRCRRIGPYP